MLPAHCLTVCSLLDSAQKHQSSILPEKFAIVLCSLIVAVFAIPVLVVIHIVSALFWGIVTVFQLLSGKGLFNEEDEL
ncbi:MAG: hypothetical protein AB1589_13635 [Cyanobacteriota bacterium]